MRRNIKNILVNEVTTTVKASEEIGVDSATIWRDIDQGLIESVRYGNVHLIDKKDIEKLKEYHFKSVK